MDIFSHSIYYNRLKIKITFRIKCTFTAKLVRALKLFNQVLIEDSSFNRLVTSYGILTKALIKIVK